jgi:hypothetical protein
MKNKALKINILLAVIMTTFISCDYSISSASEEVESSTQTTFSEQFDSDYWSGVFEDYWSYMNVNYVFWDLEEEKDGDFQDNQTETDWDDIYTEYSEKFEDLEDEDDVITRNEQALEYFSSLTSTLIDHHYYMYFKNLAVSQDSNDSSRYNISSVALTTPGETEVKSRSYYDEEYYNLDFSQYNYYNFKNISGATVLSSEEDSDGTDDRPGITDSILNIYLDEYDFSSENLIDTETAFNLMGSTDESTAEDDSTTDDSITLVDECNIPSSISDKLSNVYLVDTSTYSNSTYSSSYPFVIISALFDSDGDGSGDTPYLYFSNFYNTIYLDYADDENVEAVLDNFWDLVYNINDTGETEKIIFDLRHNTGGYVSDLSDIVSPLISEDLSMPYSYTRYKSGDNRTDYTPLIENKITGTATADDVLSDVDIIVLLDIYSVSMSEMTTIALEQVAEEIGGDIIIMGQRSWGATGPLTDSTFLDGTEDNDYYYLYTSANSFFDLDENSYEGIGISPDDGYDSDISTISYTETDGEISSWGEDSLLEEAVLY